MDPQTDAPFISTNMVLQHLETLLSVPADLDTTQNSSTVAFHPVSDPITLSCGCIISDKLAQTLVSSNKSLNKNKTKIKNTISNTFACPLCNTKNVYIVASCKNMENLFIYWTKLKEQLEHESQITSNILPKNVGLSNIEYNNSHNLNKSSDNRQDLGIQQKVDYLENDKDSADFTSMFSKISGNEQHRQLQIQQQKQPSQNIPTSPQNNLSFLTAFHEVMVEMQNLSSVESNDPALVANFNKKTSSPRDYYFDDHISSNVIHPNSHSPTNTSVMSSLGSLHKQRTKQSFSSTSNLTTLLSSNNTANTTINVHSSIPASSSNSNINSPLVNRTTPNKELLLSKNFPFFRRVYTFNIHSSNFLLKTKLYLQTQLSPNLTKLVLLSEKKWEVYTMDTDRPFKQPKLLCCGKSDGSYGSDFEHLKKVKIQQIISNSNFSNNANESVTLLENWEHLYCQITENLLIISGTRGFIRIIDLNQNGKCVFTYRCNFPIRCFDISPNENYVALGITGKDKYTQVEQAVIILLKLTLETAKSPFQISTYPFSLPYRDPIGILKFSSDSTLLSVATVLESRFLIISLIDPLKPTLVMKSQRRLDTSLDSEGITDMSFFPDNRLMTITSLSHNSEPIIIDTNLSSISGPDGIAKPKLLMKIDEVGSTIHKCCVSPRGDSVAYINRNGNVYIMTAPRMDDNDSKRVTCVLEVSNASRVKESASIRFDSDGYKLYVLDRKGILSIADFTAGTVEDSTVTRSKIIS